MNELAKYIVETFLQGYVRRLFTYYLYTAANKSKSQIAVYLTVSRDDE